MSVSVVMCTHNPRHDYLERAVGAVLTQDLGREAFEFLIVDNCSAEPVAGIPFIRESGLRVVPEPRAGLTAARECGARVSSGELLVFVDDDNVLDTSYVRVAGELLADPRIGMLSGQVEPEYETPPGAWFFAFEEAVGVRRFPTDLLYLSNIPRFSQYLPIGAGCCVRRAALLDYFDGLTAQKRIEGRVGTALSSGEDIDIALAMMEQGYLVGSCRLLKLQHLIATRRLGLRYVAALNDGSLTSGFQIDAKWRSVVGGHVFEFCESPRWLVGARLGIYFALSWLPAYWIRWRSQRTMLRLLGQAGERAA